MIQGVWMYPRSDTGVQGYPPAMSSSTPWVGYQTVCPVEELSSQFKIYTVLESSFRRPSFSFYRWYYLFPKVFYNLRSITKAMWGVSLKSLTEDYFNREIHRSEIKIDRLLLKFRGFLNINQAPHVVVDINFIILPIINFYIKIIVTFPFQ